MVCRKTASGLGQPSRRCLLLRRRNRRCEDNVSGSRFRLGSHQVRTQTGVWSANQVQGRPIKSKRTDQVNSMNSRLKSADDVVRMVIDPSKAPNLVKDLEGVRVVDGGSGEIDKKSDPKLTHMTDALGYYISKRHPVRVREQSHDRRVSYEFSRAIKRQNCLK